MYDSIKPVLLTGSWEGNFLASFLLGWAVTTGAGIASYPLDTVRRRMMMTSGEVSSQPYSGVLGFKLLILRCRLSSTSHPWMPPAKSSPTRVSDRCSRVLVPTFSVGLLALVCFPSTIRPSFLCSEKPSRVDLDRKRPPRTCAEYSPWIGEVEVYGGRCGRRDWRQAERCIRKCSTRFPKLLYCRDLVISHLYSLACTGPLHLVRLYNSSAPCAHR